jgi:hypothetical protein
MQTIKQILYSLEYDYGWLRIINSPFVKLKWKFKWYKELTAGTPYFLPRKWKKFTKKDCLNSYKEECEKFRSAGKEILKHITPESYKNYSKPVSIKYFGVNYWSLGTKTKWSNTDVRFEWGPGLSIVLFGTQIVIYPTPDCTSNALDHYWEAWIIYSKHTDKTKSVEERVKECMKLYPARWIKYEEGKQIPVNYWNYILKDKFKYLINE